MRTKFLPSAFCLIAVSLVVGLPACATNPATGQRQLILMSEAQEIQLGRESDQEVRQQMGIYKDQQLQSYVNEVGQRLARAAHRPNLPWTFTVVDQSAVNAFALPGGFVYVTRGLLPFLRNEAELAAVVGHEIGHVDARHSAQQYSKQMALGGGLAALGIFAPRTQAFQGLAGAGLQLMMLKYSREDEIQADQLGTGFAGTSGWDPHAMPALLDTLGRLDEASGSSRGVPNWALTHPPAADRVQRVQEAVAAAPQGTTTNREALERHLDGIVYGDSREQGIVRGSDFYHPDLHFAVRFPSSWEIMNGAEQVVAQPPGENSNAAIVLQVTRSGGSPEQVGRTTMSQSGFQEVDGQRTDINGLQAYVGVFDGAIDNTRARIRAAFIRNVDQTFMLAGIATASQFSGADRYFVDTIRSFRPLNGAEAARIQPARIDFYVVRPGDTWDSLARRAADVNVKASTLAIMNGSTASTPPRAGDRIRIVVPG